MCLLEMEGKFQVRKVRSIGVPLDRKDKYFDFNLSQLEGNEELKTLRQLARLLFFLPFEINKKISLNLQVSEHFTLSYFDHDHTFVKRRADSTFGKLDTGVKMTIVFSIGCKNATPLLKLYRQSETDVPNDEPLEQIKLSQNTLVLFNSRAFEYEIADASSKSIIIMSTVPGPPSPPEQAGAAFQP